MNLLFSCLEIETMLSWFGHESADAMHYGNGIGLFPFEKQLTDKLNNALEIELGSIALADSEIVVVHNWMEKATSNRFGSEKYLLPVEQMLFNKLNRAVDDITSRNRQSLQGEVDGAER